MSWKLSPSLTKLRTQINKQFPNRSKASDGTIGDPAHRRRKSDHNPDRNGWVKALDITHDTANGCDCQKIVDALVKSKDNRIKYIIWNSKIISSKVSPWRWRDYSGSNKHTKHFHISVQGRQHNNIRDWNLDFDGAAPPSPDQPSQTLKLGDTGDQVLELSQKLFRLGYIKRKSIGSKFDDDVEAAVEDFQSNTKLGNKKLSVDGKVGNNTRKAFKQELDKLGAEEIYYIVKSGDTLSKIGKFYGVTVAELKTLNNLSSTRINVDQKLLVNRFKF